MVQSQAKTVEQYLKELPPERRAVINAVRDVVNKNIHKDFQEGMGYGMMGWSVPHSIFPQGYHCDPSQPLPFAGLAAQKNAFSLYLMHIYGKPENEGVLREAFAAIGKKPDMGKCCIRFKKLEDIPLLAIGKIIKGITAKQYVDSYLRTRENYAAKKARGEGGPAKKTSKRQNVRTPKATKKKVAKKG